MNVSIPLWVLILLFFLLVVWQWALAIQTRNLRQLFEWYLNARAKDE